ncbi:MAG: phage tail protein I [Oceanospirillaceae bacterium]|nr:phage tail protein I [Oceanospirillaceae bacterium]
MASLLPPNATDLERDLETVSARISNVPVNVRDIWNADNCPAELLPWLAWSLSIDTWRTYWPEHVKRARIKSAIQVQRKKGTKRSVLEVAQSFGAESSLSEWFEQTPMGPPHSFKILLNVNELGAQTQEYTSDIVQEISRVKPCRSYFEVQQGLTVSGSLALSGAIRVAKFIRIEVDDQ